MPEKMFVDAQSRMTVLRDWVLNEGVTRDERLAVLKPRRSSVRLGEPRVTFNWTEILS